MAVMDNSQKYEETKAHEGGTPDGSHDTDSDASHASMPELIPVSPKRQPSEASQLRSSRVLGRGLLQKRHIRRGRGRGGVWFDPGDLLPNQSLQRGSLSNVPKADQEISQASPSSETPVSNTSSPPSFSLGNYASTVSGSFGKRANLLAAALDQIVSPVADQDSASPSAPTVTEIMNYTCVADGGTGDDIEISREAKRRFQASCNMEMELAGILDSDSDEEDTIPDTPGKEKKRAGASEDHKDFLPPSAVADKQALPASKRRRRNTALLKDLPPGAPSAQLAAPIVAAAASAAAAGASKTEDAERPPDDTPAGRELEKLTFGNAFGPRFTGLTPVQLQAARSSWTLHSLADVRTSSSQDNKCAAATCLAELRSRRSLGNVAESKDSPDTEVWAPAGKPVFRRPPPRQAAITPTGSMRDGTSRNAADTAVAGVRTMEACVVGSIKRRSSSDASQSVTANTTLQRNNAATSKRWRMQLSLALDGDNADVE